MANEQETPLPSTSDESALAALAPKKLEQPATWPGNVPSQEQALEILRGRLTLAVSLPGARKLQEKLTQPEREALQADGVADVLRDALLARWRLAAATDLLLTAEGRVDQAALDALLAETDRVLEAARTSNGATPELALAIDRTAETLTTEAIEFASNVKAASNQPVDRHAPVQKKAAAPAAGKVTFQAEEPQPPQSKKRSQRMQYIALAVVLLGASAYHVSNLLKSDQKPGYPGAPPYTQVVVNPSSGSLVVQSTRAGPLTPEQQAWLKSLEAKGMRVQQRGTGSYLVVPAPTAPV
ncbi:hypothetical protein, partial [Archangium sp.]|uniref:hypothetical protein n=1 Tax=Archangium sp. TaxID=1872627 RepID=UPI002EDB72DE